MMKKSLKFLATAAAFLAFGMPTFAEGEFSTSLSGSVRVQYTNDIGSDDLSKSKNQSVNSAVIAATPDETYSQLNFKYVTGESTASSFIRLYAHGEKRINFTGTTTAGDWTAKAVAEWEEEWGRYGATDVTPDQTSSISSTRDMYVSLSNGTMTFTLGSKQQFNHHRANSAYLLNTHFTGTNDSHDVGETLDNRINSFRFDYAITESMSVGALLGFDNKAKNYLFGDDELNLPSRTGNTVAANTGEQQSTTYGLFFNMKTDDLGVNFEYGAASSAGAVDIDDPSADDLKANASYLGLGVSYNIGSIILGLNYSSVSHKFTDAAVSNDGVVTLTEEIDRDGFSAYDVNIGYAINDYSGVAFSYSIKNNVEGTDGGIDAGDAERFRTGKAEKTADSSNVIELGYGTKVAGVSIKASYANASFIGKDVGNDRTVDGTFTRLRVRMQYDF